MTLGNFLNNKGYEYFLFQTMKFDQSTSCINLRDKKNTPLIYYGDVDVEWIKGRSNNMLKRIISQHLPFKQCIIYMTLPPKYASDIKMLCTYIQKKSPSRLSFVISDNRYDLLRKLQSFDFEELW